MRLLNNPFVTSGYISPLYFCDREEESARLISEIVNGNNLAIISTRRMGKTGLIQHCFHHPRLAENYYTFFIDIYATKSLRDFAYALSKVIVATLKNFGRKVFDLFLQTVASIQPGITFDSSGVPSFNLQLGDIETPEATLEQIFHYLAQADKPCIVAIDEFQQIVNYPEQNVEAMLRTHIQHCPNARFIFAGSQRHVMGNMFLSPARPFYQSVSMMHLEAIPVEKYIEFAMAHFERDNKSISPEAVRALYNRFQGVTWYLQKVLNLLYSVTPLEGSCTAEAVDRAVELVIDSFRFTYQEILYRMPEKQKSLLIAIASEREARAVTSADFVKRYRLISASSVQSALRSLLEKDFITQQDSSYTVYDQFFDIWLRENY